jgi:hypothetical protein
VHTKSSLPAPRQRLLEIIQRIAYGKILGLSIVKGEPVLSPPPRIIRDIKLGAGDNRLGVKLDTVDFELKREHLDLFEHFQALGNGTVESIEVRGGLPFRITSVEELV